MAATAWIINIIFDNTQLRVYDIEKNNNSTNVNGDLVFRRRYELHPFQYVLLTSFIIEGKKMQKIYLIFYKEELCAIKKYSKKRKLKARRNQNRW